MYLYRKCKSFNKNYRIDLLESFLDKVEDEINQIIGLGPSYKIDFDYYEYLNAKYPNADWQLYAYDKDDVCNIKSLMQAYSIKNITIKKYP